MKRFFLLLVLTLPAMAQTIVLPDYNFSLNDISKKKLTKENLFQKLNKKLVRVNDSICSNRAHVSAYDFEKQGIPSAKIFLFFTPKTGSFGGTNWWYHTSPIINEKGNLFVLDGGYPKSIKGALSLKAWLKEFNGENSVCKELRDSHTDLLELIFEASAFPETTSYGHYNCYYKITPPGYWTPGQVAKNSLGRDETGRPIRLTRDEIQKDEVLEACLEASTTPLGWTWGTTLGKCRYFVNN